MRRHRWLLLALAATGALVLLGLQVIPVMAGGLPTIAHSAVALLAIAPLAYLMGFPMPLALQRLEAAAPAAIPWAWAVNGFASVLAAPLAIATGMTIGYTAAALAAIALYAAAAFVQQRLPPRTASQVDSSP